MSYKLAFRVSAKKEWDKLDASVREPFKKKLLERLEQPRVPSAAGTASMATELQGADLG